MVFIFKENVSKNKGCSETVSKFHPSHQSNWQWPWLCCLPAFIFHFSFDSLEWSLSLLLWKQNMIVSCNIQWQTVAGVVELDKRGAKASKTCNSCKNSLYPWKWIHCVFLQHLYCFSCTVFVSTAGYSLYDCTIVWLNAHWYAENTCFIFLPNLLVIAKSFFEIWLDVW